MKLKTFVSLAALFAMVPAAPALAEGLVSLDGNVVVQRTVVENGVSKTVYEAPEKVVPGDKLIFSTDYQNNTGETVEQFVVTNPVPGAVMVAPESASELDVSVDGGANWGKLAELEVTLEDGSVRTASAADVTHVRWVLPVIANGEKGSLAYNAIVR